MSRGDGGEHRNSAQSAQSADDEASFRGPDGHGQHLGRRPAGARDCWCRASLDVSGCCLGLFSTSPGRVFGPSGPEDGAKRAPGVPCRSITSLFRLGPHCAVLGVPQTMGLCRVCWSAYRCFRQFQGNCLQVWRHSSDAGSRTVGCYRGATTLEDRVTSAAGPVPKDARSHEAQPARAV